MEIFAREVCSVYTPIGYSGSRRLLTKSNCNKKKQKCAPDCTAIEKMRGTSRPVLTRHPLIEFDITILCACPIF